MEATDNTFLKLAIDQAKRSVEEHGFPAGAVIVKDGKVISEAISTGFIHYDPSGHAETVAIRKACERLTTANLEGAILYESIECCNMCFSVAYWAGISKIVYACRKTLEMTSKGYYEGTTSNENINQSNNRRIDLLFIPEFENDSLTIIEEWERSGGFNK